MNTDVKISDLGIQINFEAFRKFNLKAIGQEGVIFFQYFAHHCRNVSVWTHSDRQLEQELGIKRTTLEKLRKQFSELGILSITKSPNDNNVRAYRMNYDALTKAEVLRTIYRLDEPDSYALKLLQQGFKECARKQPKQNAKKEKNTSDKFTPSQIREAEMFAHDLELLFIERRDLFNTKQVKANNHKVVGYVKFTKKDINHLVRVLKAFQANKQFIKNAFMAFCDQLNIRQSGMQQNEYAPKLPITIKNPLAYFLTWRNDYGTIKEFGNYHAANYRTS